MREFFFIVKYSLTELELDHGTSHTCTPLKASMTYSEGVLEFHDLGVGNVPKS